MSKNFEDIEMTARKYAPIQERMGMVSYNMYKQFIEYQQSNANTAVVFDKMAENMSYTIEYFKQSFNRLGIPTKNIYFEYDKQKYIAVVNILWNTITFASNMKGIPTALERAKDQPSLITGRIIAVKGTVPELIHGFTNETEQKLLANEVASLFVPAEKTAKAIMKIRHLSQEFQINQIDAPRDFLLKVIEMVCAGGNQHNENSRVTFNI